MRVQMVWPKNIVAGFLILTSMTVTSLALPPEETSDAEASEPAVGEIFELNDQKYEIVAKSKEKLEYLATDKELWIYAAGKVVIFDGQEPRWSTFTSRVEAAAGDKVRVLPSEPSIQVNGSPMKFDFHLMGSTFKRFKDVPMALMEKR